MKKKAAIKFVVSLILILISFLVILLLFGQYVMPWTDDWLKDTMCRFDVIMASVFKKPDLSIVEKVIPKGYNFFNGNSGFDLRCRMHRRDVKMKMEGEKYVGEAVVDIKWRGDPDLIRSVADEVANCWWRFGEGRYDFYTDVDYNWKSKKMCFICTEFRSRGGEVINLDLKKLFRFMATEPYGGLLKKKTTYFGYITGTGGYEGKYALNTEEVRIDKDNNLYVVFIIDKQEEGSYWERFGESLKEVGVSVSAGIILGTIIGKSKAGSIIGSVAGLIAGIGNVVEKKGWNNAIILVSSDEVYKVCDQFVPEKKG